MHRFKSINSKHMFTRVKRKYSSTRAKRTYRFTKDHTALLGLTGSKDLHTLTGHPGLLKFLDWIDLIFLGFDNDPILIVPILHGCNRV